MENFISIIDYIGEINNGVAILMSMKLNDNIYELTYWFNEKDEYLISTDNKFLKDLKISNIYEYKNYKKLAHFNIPTEPQNIDPIYTNLFELKFKCKNLTLEENEQLNQSAISLTEKNIKFNVNYIDDNIIPFIQLEKIKNSIFDIELELYNKCGGVISRFLLKNCKISYSYNQILNFSWETYDIIKAFKIDYSFENIILL